MSEEKEKFSQITKIVIDKMEGGYYHPNMRLKNPKKFAAYGTSGETMFGIDRVAGGSINKTAAGKKFWSIIDNADAKNLWKWGSMGGNLRPQLENLVVEIIYPEFVYLKDRYLSDRAQNLVFSDPRLLFHFIYATWNGPGWFKKFATDFSKKVKEGASNTNILVEYMNDLRTKEGLRKNSPPNSLIKQGGEKIKTFIDSLQNNEFIKTTAKLTPILLMIIAFSVYIINKKLYNA